MEKTKTGNTLADLSLYLLTWNVIGTNPTEDLRRVLGLQSDNDDDVPDMYGIGLQELPTSPQAFVMSTLFEEPWAKAFRDVLGKRDHVLVKSIRLFGMMIMFFIKRKHLIHLRNVQTDYTRTGFGGVWGNKGGVTIRFDIYGKSICLTNCHLAAHDHELVQRIRDYHSIIEGQVFEGNTVKEILDHDYVFWFGDLNFRLNNYTAEKIADMIQKEEWERLLDSDQLLDVIKNKEAFAEFKELPPPFKPSYKFVINTNTYDLRRKPAWTDRILFKINSNNMASLDLHQKNYSMFEEYFQSDHKPVTAEFSISQNIQMDVEPVVKFDPIDRWFIGEDGPCVYTYNLRRESTSWDWIGLYKASFSSLSDYVTFIWSAPGNGIEQRKSAFPDIGAPPGQYRLLYISNEDMNILGMSEPFEVV